MANWKERLLQALSTASNTQSQTTLTDRAVDAKLEQGDIKGATDMAKAGAAGAASGFMTSLLLPEFSTYGLLGGASRIAGGTAGSVIGSTALGKVGDKIDKKYKTNWVGTTGRIIGGFAGWPTGSNFAYKGALDLASKVPSLAKIGTTNRFIGDVAGRVLGKNINSTSFIPAQVKYYGPTMGKSYAAKTNTNLIDLDTWGRSEYDQLAKKYGYKDWREMILSDKGDYNEEYKQLIKDQISRIQSDPQYSGKTIVISNASLLKPNSGVTFANTPVIPERSVMAVRNNYRHPWESIEHGKQWWDNLQAKGTPLRIDNRFVSEIEGNKVIQFTHAKPKYVSTYHYDPRVKQFRPLSLAERLGIPKSLRSNPKALEDPYYWGYQQWNSRYNATVNSGNIQEAQRLRDLHFKIKAPDTITIDPWYHSTNNQYWIPNLDYRSSWGPIDAYIHVGTRKAAQTIGGKRMLKLYINQKNPLKTYDGIQDAQMNIINEIANTKNLSELEKQSLYKEWKAALDNVHYDDVSIVRNNKVRELLSRYGFDGIEYINNAEDVGSISRGLIKPTQVKLSNPITRTDTGEIIPIVKRDNFHNPDIRYKQGGTLKAQPGMVLPTIPSVLARTYNKLENILTPIKKWEQKYNVKANASLGPLELLNPEAFVGIELETLDKAHRGVELAKEVKTIKEIPELSPKARFEAIFKRTIKQPVSKSEKGLYSYVEKHHPDDLVNWEKYMDEYVKYWK